MKDLHHCLWFKGEAEEAARFYVDLVPGSRLGKVHRNVMDTPGGRKGEVMMVDFTLAGRAHLALNGNPNYAFTPAISLCAACESQEELDRIWDALAEGGQPMRCGWITDRYGVTWQVFPSQLMTMMSADDGAKVASMTAAMMAMVKLDLAALEAAFASGGKAA